jgi:hypothetical protein
MLLPQTSNTMLLLPREDLLSGPGTVPCRSLRPLAKCPQALIRILSELDIFK